MSGPVLDGFNPQRWPCGTCQAGPGEPCVSRSGRSTRVHTDRRVSVRLFARYGRLAALGPGA